MRGREGEREEGASWVKKRGDIIEKDVDLLSDKRKQGRSRVDSESARGRDGTPLSSREFLKTCRDWRLKKRDLYFRV